MTTQQREQETEPLGILRPGFRDEVFELGDLGG
jgi:hypothetical protein